MHNTPLLPHHQTFSFLYVGNHPQASAVWPASFLPSTHLVSLVKLIVHPWPPGFCWQQTVWVCTVNTALQGPCVNICCWAAVPTKGKGTKLSEEWKSPDQGGSPYMTPRSLWSLPATEFRPGRGLREVTCSRPCFRAATRFSLFYRKDN